MSIELEQKGAAVQADADGGRGASSVSHQRAGGLWQRAKRSVWAEVVLKSLGIVLGMALLAGIGCYSIASGIGVRVPLDGEIGKEVSGPWLSVPNLARAQAAPSAVTSTNILTLHQAPSRGSAQSRKREEPPASLAITDDGKVILNLANEADLRRLPGIGKKRAQAILALREKLGGKFKRTTDLLRVRGIGMKFYKRILPHLVLDPPAQPATRTASARNVPTKL